jgi:hypothetical protein
MNFVDKIINANVKFLWILLVVVLLVPLIKPIGLPLPMKEETLSAYDFAESLPSGSWIIMSINISPMGEPENWASAVAMYRHYMKKDFKIILLNTVPEGTMYAEKLWKNFSPEYEYEYGKNVVQMPFRAGNESAISSMGADFRGLYATDQYNTPLDDIPLFDGFRGIEDVSFLVEYASTIHPLYYLQQINAKYGVPMIVSIVAVDGPKFMPYYKSGQLKGLMSGVAAGAEYELLNKTPGPGASQMDALALGHLMFILAIVLSNIAWWLSKNQEYQKGGAH